LHVRHCVDLYQWRQHRIAYGHLVLVLIDRAYVSGDID
jgi:hypothetical protein